MTNNQIQLLQLKMLCFVVASLLAIFASGFICEHLAGLPIDTECFSIAPSPFIWVWLEKRIVRRVDPAALGTFAGGGSSGSLGTNTVFGDGSAALHGELELMLGALMLEADTEGQMQSY